MSSTSAAVAAGWSTTSPGARDWRTSIPSRCAFNGPVFFVRDPGIFKLPKRTPWLRVAFADLAKTGSGPLAAVADLGVEDPTQGLKSLQESTGGAKRVGEETLHGSKTTHYRAQRDPDGAAGPARPTAVDVWVDDEGYLRKIETVTRDASETVSTRTEFDDFGVAVDGELPPPKGRVGGMVGAGTAARITRIHSRARTSNRQWGEPTQTLADTGGAVLFRCHPLIEQMLLSRRHDPAEHPVQVRAAVNRRRLTKPLVVAAGCTLLAQAISVFSGGGAGPLSSATFGEVARDGAYIAASALCGLQALRAPRHRIPMALLSVALTVFTGANLYIAMGAGGRALAAPPPALAVTLWMGFYPPILTAMLLLLAARRRARLGVKLDALIAALTVATVGVFLVIDPVVARVGAQSRSAMNTAFPIADIVVLSLIAAVLTIHGWKATRGWRLMALGLVIFSIGDAFYARQLADAAYRPGTPQDLLWTVGLVVMALAAGRVTASAPTGRQPGWMTLILPIGGLVGGAGLLLHGDFVRLPSLTVWFAAAAILVSVVRVAVMVRDLRRLADSALEARTDELTGLPNRRGFLEKLDQAARSRSDGQFALMVADVDSFKEINDTLGHATGDQVLREIARRLRGALGKRTVVARLGGDEFAAIIRTADHDPPSKLGAAFADAMREPLHVRGIDLALRISVGIALYPDHGTDGETLFQHADVAMYRAKEQRKGFGVYEPDADPYTTDRLRLVSDLNRALDHGELVLHYQPKVDAFTRQLRGVEALVRWMHPTRGLIPPIDFIPIAERTGLVLRLTDQVLAMALDQLAEWRTAGIETEVAVNIPEACLLDDTLADRLAAQLDLRGLPAAALRLELTETAVMSDPVRVSKVIDSVRALGVGVSLDDFGTGYSSLSQLRNLFADELKIDKSFVQEIGRDRDSEAIVELSIELGRRLGIAVVAEGVETDGTWQALARLGCGVLQGYVISRPLPAEQFSAWLAGWLSSADAPDVDPLSAWTPSKVFAAEVAERGR